MERAYQEVIEFIAAGTTPNNVIAFRPSPATKERVETLIQRQKTVGLSEDEKSELEHTMQLEHLMRLAKARAASSHSLSAREMQKIALQVLAARS